MQTEITQDLAQVSQIKSKREIEQYSLFRVSQEVEEGFIDARHELVVATKLQAFFAARVSALREYAFVDMKEDKEISILGSKLQKSKEAGRWEYNDAYLEELKEEIKTVQGRCQKSTEKDRYHITLSGEGITLSQGIKSEGGETVKVVL